MRVLGAPPEAIEEWQAQLNDQDAENVVTLPADCRQAVHAFIAVSTQWKRLLVGDRLLATGLDYSGVREALRFLRIRTSPELFADLQLMENTALDAWSEGR